MMNAIALDDEPLALDVIKNFCEKTDLVNLKRTFTSPAEALTYLRQEPTDLIFLDINMPGKNGIDFSKALDISVMVIFTTAHSEYAVEGFNVKAIDYLLKPFKLSRFMQAVEKAKEHLNYLNTLDPTSQYLYIRADYTTQKIFLNDIVYIEGMDNYIKFHFDGRKPLLVRMSMKSICEKLPEQSFSRIHRSYIVPLAKVSVVKNKMVYIGTTELPIGMNYHDTFMSALNK